jgi:hypothetical protein
MNSVLFNNNNNTSSRPPPSHIANPTLANLQDAQDTSVTALPQPPAVASASAKPAKEGFWKRILAKIKKSLTFEWKRKEKKEEEREMCIGEPTDFKHVLTSGPRPLRTVPVVVEEEESEWEDMGESEAGRDSVAVRR